MVLPFLLAVCCDFNVKCSPQAYVLSTWCGVLLEGRGTFKKQNLLEEVKHWGWA